MKINNLEVKAKQFAYDDCHKIYIIEDDEDLLDAKRANYTILPIEKIEETYKNSCELRFIYNWNLDKTYARQYETANFEF